MLLKACGPSKSQLLRCYEVSMMADERHTHCYFQYKIQVGDTWSHHCSSHLGLNSKILKDFFQQSKLSSHFNPFWPIKWNLFDPSWINNNFNIKLVIVFLFPICLIVIIIIFFRIWHFIINLLVNHMLFFFFSWPAYSTVIYVPCWY